MSCSGRVLSALVNTSNGPFVYLMDICALSPDYSSKAGVVQSIRVSSRNEACGIALEWNPQLEGVFAVIANDGTLSTYLFDIQVCFIRLILVVNTRIFCDIQRFVTLSGYCDFCEIIFV
ncbi:unnamed protein product [Anisakis simplex]|uniref:Nucleoporin_N domain-containing protein n=1 Tax=Anisakis simplex TaxID=6269 RepID=A0A0M3JEF2_ANISI|nr:unnamed protein product [Anisakis simplex]